MAILEFDKVCPNCGAADVEVSNYADDVEHKGFVLSVEGLQEHVCNSCGHDWKTQSDFEHDLEILKSAFVIVRDKKRAEEGLLTGKEIENIRTFFDINQREAAALFGGGYNAFNKYESGEVLQSFAMDRLLRMTKAFGKHAIEFLKNVHTEQEYVVYKTVRFDTANMPYNQVAKSHTSSAHAVDVGLDMSAIFAIAPHQNSREAVVYAR